MVNGIREEYARIRRDEEERLAREMAQRFEARAEAARERERLEARQGVESLLAAVDAWHRSQQIRACLSSFRATVEKWSGPIDPKSEVAKWLRWATRYAEASTPDVRICDLHPSKAYKQSTSPLRIENKLCVLIVPSAHRPPTEPPASVGLVKAAADHQSVCISLASFKPSSRKS